MSSKKKITNLKKLIYYNKLLSYSLSSIVLSLYFLFILILAFNPSLFGIFIFKNSISLGIFLGLSIILISIVSTLIYVIIANFFLDKIKEKI